MQTAATYNQGVCASTLPTEDMLHLGTIDPSLAALLERARASMPGGVNSDQRQIPELEDLVITSTSGATFTDSYGRTYTDYHAGLRPATSGSQ